MSTTFPRLQEDELLYSGVARYANIEQCEPTSRTGIGKMLLGKPSFYINVDFPSDLNFFVSRLSKAYPINGPVILQKHTMFPAVAPFISQKVRMGTEKCLLEGRRHTSTRLSNLLFGFRSGLWACQKCVRKEVKALGFSFWHRRLQLVPYCEKHHCTATRCLDAGDPKSFGYIDPEEALKGRIVELDRNQSSFLSGMAKGAKYLFEANELFPDSWQIHLALSAIVQSETSGNARRSNKNWWKNQKKISDLNRALLENIYGKKFLDANVINACRRISRPVSVVGTLVICQIFGKTPREILKAAMDVEQRGEIWPCMNDDAACFGWPTVRRYFVTGRRASFTCPECGQKYYRQFPLQTNPSGKFGFELCFGPESPSWKTLLVKSWLRPNANFLEVAAKVGKSQQTILTAAMKLKLPAIEGVPEYFRASHEFEIDQLRHQSTLILERQEDEGMTRAKFWAIAPQAARWLKKWNPEWLNEQLPKKTRRVRGGAIGAKEELLRLDDCLLEQLKAVAAEIRTLRPPVKVTKSLLLRNACQFVLQSPQRIRLKFPQTEKRAIELEESRSMFHSRRIEIAYNDLFRAGDSAPSLRAVIISAGLNHIWAQKKIDRELLDRVYRDLCSGVRTQLDLGFE